MEYKSQQTFIIVCPSYEDDSGGTIVLHKLCDLLNKAGQKALVWQIWKPIFNTTKPFSSIYKILKFHRKKRPFNISKHLDTPIAKYSDFRNAIVVYPEIINGNPLGAKHVVRWLLLHPKPQTKKFSYGENELYFYYLKAYDDSSLNKYPNNVLFIPNNREETYYQTNFKEREGSCYVIRKGHGRQIIHDTKGSTKIDGLPHNEIAKIFNQAKYFYTYDIYTMYSCYAAMCGCIPIVIPKEGISKEEWQPEKEYTYGTAYGFDDIQYAIDTREDLLVHLRKQNDNVMKNINSFIVKCYEYFKTVSH